MSVPSQDKKFSLFTSSILSAKSSPHKAKNIPRGTFQSLSTYSGGEGEAEESKAGRKVVRSVSKERPKQREEEEGSAKEDRTLQSKLRLNFKHTNDKVDLAKFIKKMSSSKPEKKEQEKREPEKKENTL